MAQNTMITALKIIAATSPDAAGEALKCIKSIAADSPLVQRRYNNVTQLAFDDYNATFDVAQRKMIAGFIKLPKSAAPEARDDVVRLRITATERAQIEADAGALEMKLSEYLRFKLEI